MTYENKIAMVSRDDLQSWQKLNVAAFNVGESKKEDEQMLINDADYIEQIDQQRELH